MPKGGAAALHWVARRAARGLPPLGGCVAVSASLLEESLPALEEPPAVTTSGTPCLLTHGDADAMVPRWAVERSAARLKAGGCQAELQTLPGKGHAMVSSEREMRLLMAFWGNRLRHRPPNETLVEV